jgi:hypothetical protein
MHIDTLTKKLMEVLPDLAYDTDNEGQIIIYTNLQYKDGTDDVEQFVPKN